MLHPLWMNQHGWTVKNQIDAIHDHQLTIAELEISNDPIDREVSMKLQADCQLMNDELAIFINERGLM
jgi:hypothetical protein